MNKQPQFTEAELDCLIKGFCLGCRTQIYEFSDPLSTLQSKLFKQCLEYLGED